MAIYAISDLHLSFGDNKPMDIFGVNWENHTEKIRENWIKKVTDNDLVLLPGDFSWATYLQNTHMDFKYLSSMPGKKILLKGNHDYWWTSLKKMREYLKENNFKNIDFLHNNSYMFENKIIVGTRGWQDENNSEDKRITKREIIRLELSIQDGIKKCGTEKEIIVCMHYPPFNNYIEKEFSYIDIMKKYNVTKCIYGHLHGESTQSDAKQGIIDGIYFKLVSCDYTGFDLLKII